MLENADTSENVTSTGRIVPVATGTTRPGEYIHYYMNLLSLFGRERPLADIQEAATAASALREATIDGFASRLHALNADFSSQRATSGQRPERMPVPFMRGWDDAPIEAIATAHGGLLIALFHYGEHRHVFSDLASLGVPYVAPVAKQAYFDCCEMLGQGPDAFRHAMSLIEVEDPRVGRKLFSGLRQGRVGLIYVDGNMGPDGHRVEEGAVRIDFLGKRIRVKAGIARLAIGLGLPVLPLFAMRDEGATTVHFGDPILPPDRKRVGEDAFGEPALTSIMQTLYTGLARHVHQAPQHWEFAFCFHRWLDECEATAPAVADDATLAPAQALRFDRQRITEFLRDGEVFWIHVGRQRAYRLPAWAGGLHARLEPGHATVAESLEFLQGAGGSADEARDLLSQLKCKGLLDTMSVAT
jgi:hypothetical protein